uniref:Uncharacterized protein n=1 Tax=Cacopsylla melanoneura TaxID=428564 RepID=A0A8D8QAT9_9HEMI
MPVLLDPLQAAPEIMTQFYYRTHIGWILDINLLGVIYVGNNYIEASLCILEILYHYFYPISCVALYSTVVGTRKSDKFRDRSDVAGSIPRHGNFFIILMEK